MFKKIISYIICGSTPKAIVEAINEAATVDELDAAVIEAAGFLPRKKKGVYHEA